MAQPNPEARLQSLPPILRRTNRKSLPSCSEGSWGLSVLPRVEGIFTPSAISLSPWSRQCGCCYAIRAGRNLPDKEFRSVILDVSVKAGLYLSSTSVHLACQAPNLFESCFRQMLLALEEQESTAKLLEVLPLTCLERVPHEEGDDDHQYQSRRARGCKCSNRRIKVRANRLSRSRRV